MYNDSYVRGGLSAYVCIAYTGVICVDGNLGEMLWGWGDKVFVIFRGYDDGV